MTRLLVLAALLAALVVLLTVLVMHWPRMMAAPEGCSTSTATIPAQAGRAAESLLITVCRSAW